MSRPAAWLRGDRLALAAALAGVAVLVWQSPTESSPAAFLAGAAGLAAVHERIRREFGAAVALLTSLLVLGATSLFWSMTTTGFAETSAFGMVAALLLVSERLLRPARIAIWCLATILPFAMPLAIGDDGAARAAGNEGRAALLFSSSHGLLSLYPVVYAALLGTIIYLRRNPVWSAGALATLAFWIGVPVAPPPESTGPASHGLSAALATLAPGLALLLAWARARPGIAVAALVAAALSWNYWLMVQYTVGLLPKDAPVSFAAMVRQQAEVRTSSPYVYPFAFPANVWFAWREGVPAERYELLAPVPVSDTLDLTMDGRADRFVLDGWESRGAGPAEPVRWIGERRASLVVPMQPSAGRALGVTITARARLEQPAVDAELALEVNGHEVGRFTVRPDAPADVLVRIPDPAVGRIFRAGYNRLTFVSLGVHRAGPSETPESAASGARNRVWPVAVYRVRIAPE